MAIEWGSTYCTTQYFAFRLGLNFTTTVTNANVTVKTDVYAWSGWKIEDSSINLFYRAGVGVTSAYDSKHTYLVATPSLYCYGDTSSGWPTENQKLLYSVSQIFSREESAKVINFCASIGSVAGYNSGATPLSGYSGGVISVCKSVTIPALPTYTITYNANGGTGAPSSQTKTHGIPIRIPSQTPTRTGYTFKGWALSEEFAEDGLVAYYAGDWCPLNSDKTLYAVWQINTWTNTVTNWLYGFKKGEGTNANKDTYNFGNTSFVSQYGSTVTLNAAKTKTAPNGIYLRDFGTSELAGSFTWYGVGTTVTQPDKGFGVGAYFEPINYTITYDLNGGSFDVTPPTSYNVLYEVLFLTPKRAGYSFVGWYVDGWDLPVSGVNVGANASFTSAEDLYAKLATRTTGNITVTARWADNGTAHAKQDGVWKKGQVWFKGAGIWKRGIPWVKVNGEWKRGGA